MIAKTVLSRHQFINSFLVLSPEQSVNTIEKFYETSDWVFPKLRKKDNYGQFKFCVLAPQYQNHATYFLKEIHRLSDFSVLLYKIQTADYERNSKSGPCNNILQTLIPITPKRQNSCYEGIKHAHSFRMLSKIFQIVQETQPTVKPRSKPCSSPRLAIAVCRGLFSPKRS